MYSFLPEKLRKFYLSNQENIYEIRIRKEAPVTVNYAGNFISIKIEGQYLVYTAEEISLILTKACNNSIYKYNEYIKNGYISCGQGIRIGIAGECVTESGIIKTIKNFHSLCIRFPHQVIGCADKAFEIINANNGIKSLLVISPPGVGKTTLLRDITRIISDIKMLNILVIDEKNEIYYDGCNIGKTTDVINGCDKAFGFYTAIKTLSPDVVIADEITTEQEANGAMFASLSGVKIICSVHGNSLKDVKKKKYMQLLFNEKCFDKCVLLKKNNAGFLTFEEAIEYEL
ncbi:MAG: hypothetical protein IJA15_08165 [Clostridia bacterium]|nr:hypothetical protein [Clostridia bacterium]